MSMPSRIASSRRIITTAVLGVLFSLALPAQQQDKLYTATHQQLQVVKIVLAQEAAWNKGDLDGFLAHFKDDPETLAVLGARARGLATIRNAFRSNYPNRDAMGNLDYSDVEARELGENFCLATGKYHVERNKKNGGPADGTFTEVFEKTAKGWEIIFSETT